MNARVKPVPEPPTSMDALGAIQRSVPLVPALAADCERRLVERTDLDDRRAARMWLAFLRALELVERGDSGTRRRRIGPDRERLRPAFLEGVFGARELHAVLVCADAPLSTDAAFERVRGDVPTWECHRDPNRWHDRWRDRTGRLLDWAVFLGLADRTGTGYVAASSSGTSAPDGDSERA